MKRIIVSSIILSAIFSMTGCKKFLDKEPIALVNSVGFYNTEANTILATNAIYDPMGWGDHESITMQMIGDCNSDDCEVGGQSVGATDMAEFSLYSLYKPNPPFTITTHFLQNYYVGIQRANTLLWGTDPANSQYSGNYKVSRYRGEASFLRALYNFQLAEVFGPMPIMIPDATGVVNEYPGNIQSGDDAMGTKQIEAIYKLIISDLTYAAKNLPSKNQYSASDAGRATRGAAWGLLAKVYAFMASYNQNSFLFKDSVSQALWRKVDSCATLVTNDGSYSLVPDYHKLFTIQGENGPESLFEIQTLPSNQQGSVGGGNKAEATIRVCDFAPRSWFSTSGTSVLNNGTIGYGLHSPTKELVAAFDLNNNGAIQHWPTGAYSPQIPLGTAQSGASKTYSWIFNDMKQNQPDLLHQYTDYDPRIDLIVKPNDSLFDNIYHPKAPVWERFCAYTVPYNSNIVSQSQINSFTCTGFWDRKTMAAVNDTANPQTRALNLIVLRYADILLLQAEAEFNLGNVNGALTNVNLIRARARASRWVPGNTASGYMNGYQLAASTTPAPLTTISSIQDIYNERRLELFCEGQRFFDLVRWGLADGICPNRPTEYHGNSFSAWKPNKQSYFQPILPQIVTEGKGTIIQNPGY